MFPRPMTRRESLRAASCGFGYLAFAALADRAAAAANPLAPRAPHFAPRAKRVIFLFMPGGPSHVDTFDYKPQLQKLDGKAPPAEVAKKIQKAKGGDMLLASPWKFKQHGKSGLWASELFPETAKLADDLCVLNGMHCDSPNHETATRQAHTGATNFLRPSVGAWALYGLGSENDSLPGFVTVGQLGRAGSAECRGSAFLPATYQGTPVGTGAIANLAGGLPRGVQREQIRAMRGLAEASGAADPRLEGVIGSFELAFRMQAVAPEVLDLSRETPQTHKLYGVGEKETDAFGRSCLLARRLAEAGVRFVEVGGGIWDHHARLKEELPEVARATDKPVAGLLADLKRRGLLEDTLVIWGGEFGRLPANGGGNRNGRDHDHHGYTVWLAGGGVRGGLRYGATDPLGFAAVDGKVHVHDLHATVLHLLGLDHTKLTYRHSGRDFRLTDVYGNVVKAVLA